MLNVNYVVCITEQGRKNREQFSLTARAGDSIFIHTALRRCECHFETLSGLCRPQTGTVSLLGTDLYALPETELAAFRRDNIGAVPFGGGLIPEIPIIDQILLPLKLAGIPGDQMLGEVEKRISDLLPMHSLYNTPRRVSPRKQTHAAIVRAAIHSPSLLILDRTLDGFDAIDSGILWQALTDLRRDNSVLLYFSSDPAPSQIPWTQCLQI